MSLLRPLRRTCRPFKDGKYGSNGNWRYLLHPQYAQEPRHYIRAFLLLQRDLIDLFDFIEPADVNLPTYSHRIQQLLMRTCVEIEANFVAILSEHGYSKAKDKWSMVDYRRINTTHHLGSYEVQIPGWTGQSAIRQPFAPWSTPQGGLRWYQTYNKSKHDRHNHFPSANFQSLIDAMAGLVTLISAQFWKEDNSPGQKTISWISPHSYDGNDGMQIAIGDFFKVRFPTDWGEKDLYDFNWTDIEKEPFPVSTYDYNSAAQQLTTTRTQFDQISAQPSPEG